MEPAGHDGRALDVNGRPRAPVLAKKINGPGLNGQFLNSIWTGRGGLHKHARATTLNQIKKKQVCEYFPQKIYTALGYDQTKTGLMSTKSYLGQTVWLMLEKYEA